MRTKEIKRVIRPKKNHLDTIIKSRLNQDLRKRTHYKKIPPSILNAIIDYKKKKSAYFIGIIVNFKGKSNVFTKSKSLHLHVIYTSSEL